MMLELLQQDLERSLQLEESFWEARAALQEVTAFRLSIENKIAQLKAKMS